MEDDLKKKKKKGRRSKQNWKMNQSTKINLIGCDTIVNSPSFLQKCEYYSPLSHQMLKQDPIGLGSWGKEQSYLFEAAKSP